mgnify:CR=1 FL=1
MERVDKMNKNNFTEEEKQKINYLKRRLLVLYGKCDNSTEISCKIAIVHKLFLELFEKEEKEIRFIDMKLNLIYDMVTECENELSLYEDSKLKM